VNKNKKILLAFYGDDFTGSTDALEFIARAGAKVILFIEPPTKEQLLTYPDLDAFGVAGMTRSLSPTEMEKVLIPAFEKIKLSGARHVHYKVCSTFDSSPATGSIGKAIDCGSQVYRASVVPVLGGMPALGRYCVFGNLFAQMGIGSNGAIYRLDRHPSMSKHPVTPADESDLLLHLSKQTKKKIGLINIFQVDGDINKIDRAVDQLIMNGCDIALMDTLYTEQLTTIGEHLDEFAQDSERILFSVGSSGIEMALGNYWNDQKILNPRTEWKYPGKANPLLVISGSCSPVTDAQIVWARNNDFEEVELDAVQICNDGIVDAKMQQRVNELVKKQKNLIVHTGKKQAQNLSSEKLGTALGTIAKEAVKNSSVKRVVVAGGDTSSYAARAMDIEAVEMIAPLVAGAPLCRAISKNKIIDGLEVNFKGGQVGGEDYFGLMMRGG
jgi:3-oxoisoapionate kinase